MRLTVVAAIVVGTVVVISLVFGLLAHVAALRAISTGFYLVSALLLALGFFHGVRPPVRVDGGGRSLSGGMFGLLFSTGTVRGATPDEHRDSRVSAALFIGLALLMVVLGGVLDPAHRVL
ncbi:MAG TPA: hypothetical protein VKV34_02240 [Thermoleophilia bacterium]|nr:hypothetical protein [Thermoleophilia bacterium]